MTAGLWALETVGLCKDYGDRPALTPTSLTIGAGERVVMVGHNGSGKTTLLRMSAGLLDPSDGKVIVHGRPSGSAPARRMLAYLGDAENRGAALVLNSPVTGGAVESDGIRLEVGGADPMNILCKTVINAAGHGAPAASRAISGIPPGTIPTNYYAIGHYYTLTGKTPFNHLVYPVARQDWLGVHVTIDLGGRCKFGPDFSWRDGLDYRFDESREARFYEAIRRYYPGLKDGALQPGYTGMRPRITGQGEEAVDFVIQDHTVHGVRGMINLYGMESPGLTSSLAIGAYVGKLVANDRS